MDVVTSKVRTIDPTISDEKARSALGALGLVGEKSIRKVGFLSGGEKARVALASFVLIPNNLLLLDEPSNHLDMATLKVLTSALRKFEGTTIVISHDRTFLEELEPTHVISVRNGVVDLQERGLREDDWNDPIDSRDNEDCNQKFASTSSSSVPTGAKGATATSASASVVTVAAVADDPELKKKQLNAPRRITKIESSLAKHETEMAAIDDEMFQFGRDRGKLQDLQKKKDETQAKIDKLYAEYEELLDLIT